MRGHVEEKWAQSGQGRRGGLAGAGACRHLGSLPFWRTGERRHLLKKAKLQRLLENCLWETGTFFAKGNGKNVAPKRLGLGREGRLGARGAQELNAAGSHLPCGSTRGIRPEQSHRVILSP